MSNLPAGVTNTDIDRAVGEGSVGSWPYMVECDHESALDDAWVECEKQPEFDGFTYDSPEIRRLQDAPKSFTDRDVDIYVFPGYYTVDIAWKCPVCGEDHEDSFEEADFRD